MRSDVFIGKVARAVPQRWALDKNALHLGAVAFILPSGLIKRPWPRCWPICSSALCALLSGVAGTIDVSGYDPALDSTLAWASKAPSRKGLAATQAD
jgi:hypothetical protein